MEGANPCRGRSIAYIVAAEQLVSEDPSPALIPYNPCWRRPAISEDTGGAGGNSVCRVLKVAVQSSRRTDPALIAAAPCCRALEDSKMAAIHVEIRKRCNYHGKIAKGARL